MSKLYLKSLTINEHNQLTSCHGGRQDWNVGETVSIPEDQRGQPCGRGALHALRVRDLPFWLGTHYAVVEMPDAKAHDNKVYGYEQTIVRVADEGFDGLAMLVDFADYCAQQGENYDDAKAAEWIAARFPAGFLDDVER